MDNGRNSYVLTFRNGLNEVFYLVVGIICAQARSPFVLSIPLVVVVVIIIIIIIITTIITIIIKIIIIIIIITITIIIIIIIIIIITTTFWPFSRLNK